MNTQYSRIICKRTNTTGAIPTIPVTTEHIDGQWLTTDIYSGEIYINETDLRMWYRAGDTIVELSTNVSDLTIATSRISVDTTGTTNIAYFCESGLTLTLPSAIGIPGKNINIINKSLSTITLIPVLGQTISGALSKSLIYQWSSIQIISDGLNWLVFG